MFNFSPLFLPMLVFLGWLWLKLSKYRNRLYVQAQSDEATIRSYDYI